ncbi:FAD-NAD(P)-binding protein [Erwiniaceae bacterium BAC15a-03b]|uniref:FAD-NAD(P)-binding protein n=1 Tax=Winslowiella arboricola TaxID=2978220 RepID=A0A9J6PS99_9GAMM|nr:FAD-NAD(P)-binding protein [Winslowiella arboricola]MCU5775265.1 FAD-NAD(P)-binding protein [Winslowiella arboricola]MCU5780338.1 FAD-NAD(P)-binding protein [Winslowiella arboricola]
MKRIAIIGAGPTGIYTFFSIINNRTPFSVSVYEQGKEAGVGMPYSNEENSSIMLANIASIEIPPVFSSYIDWLRSQSEEYLSRYDVQLSSLHVRQFLPRILLGDYFRNQFLALVAYAKEHGFEVEVHESCLVTDLEATSEGIGLWTEGASAPVQFDFAVIATGHVWPDEKESTRTFFPSPWSGLMDAKIRACKVGIMGTSLSAFDAAMAVAVQHGAFLETDDKHVKFMCDDGSEALKIVLMSRTGIIPEADFYCPIPYEPLRIATQEAIQNEIASGSDGLLNRIFRLIVEEIECADPAWSKDISLQTLNADTFSDAWFSDRKKRDPFLWAKSNLDEVERNKHDKRTIPWRYTILRLHEAVQEIVPYLNQHDSERFNAGLARVFIDNYAAVPSESIRRLLALREAGIISILTLGSDYRMDIKENETVIYVDAYSQSFDVFIDARGQQPLKTRDLPFPTLRKQLQASGDDIPDLGDDYTLMAPASARGRIALGALPYLMYDQPFVQGLTVCAEIGAAIAKATIKSASRIRRRLPLTDL